MAARASARLGASLIAASGAAPQAVHVAIEVPHGQVVEALIERGFTVYAVNTDGLDRFRDRFTLTAAKDDSRDAEVLADALRAEPGRALVRCGRPIRWSSSCANE